MPNPLIATRRLDASGLLATSFTTPEEVVGWFGAVQSQDYPGASWGLGQRLGPGVTAGDMDAVFDAGRILRTHAMRPTWHFLLPTDIRWVLKLTSHRVQRLNATYYRKTGLDAHTLARAAEVIAAALDGGRHLTRPELAKAVRGRTDRDRRPAPQPHRHERRARGRHRQRAPTRQAVHLCAAGRAGCGAGEPRGR